MTLSSKSAYKKLTWIPLIVLIIGYGINVEITHAQTETSDSDSMSKKIILAAVENRDKQAAKSLRMIYKEVSVRTGIDIELKYFPASTAGSFVERGVVDGEAGRVFEFGMEHPELIRVEEPFLQITFGAFSKKTNLSLNGWESLKNKQLRIEYSRGTVLVQKRLEGIEGVSNITKVDTYYQGLKKLRANRTDVFIGLTLLIGYQLKEKRELFSGIKQVGVMETVPIYAYLNKTHEQFAPLISDAFKHMKKEGGINRIIRQVFEIK